MSELNFPPEAIVYAVQAGACNGGPLDGSGFWLQLPVDLDVGQIHVNLAVGEHVHCYVYDPQSKPGTFDVGLTYRGRLA